MPICSPPQCITVAYSRPGGYSLTPSQPGGVW
nr:MAG TPA: hypothetical protein [Caudoviricetes sp.]